MLRTLYFLLLLLLLVGCGPNSTANSTNDDVEFKQLSTHDTSIEQKESNHAKEILSKEDGLTNVHAVNSDKKMIIAFEIDHLKRFQLKDYEKKITKQMKKEFSNMDVDVSTDQKIVIEVSELEQKIASGSISKKELNKKINNVIKLAKEKT